VSWNVWKIGKLIKESKPDYLHLATEGTLGLAAKLWADWHAIPYTTSYNTRFPEYFVEYFGCGLSLGYRAITWFHRKSRTVMVNTPTMAELLATYSLTNIALWGRGVDTDLFTPIGPIADCLDGLRRPILMNVGRVAIEKNLPAFYALHGTKVQVGSGPMLDEYRQSYPDVHFVGAKTGEELASYYRGADVFVFPSLSDTYGLVMLESIASGVPVAAYPADGPRDVLAPCVGSMHGDLRMAVQQALRLTDKQRLYTWALDKSWSACTDTFISHLAPIRR
jgi:glycosyltransferase involved in cell wall biosynthesis